MEPEQFGWILPVFWVLLQCEGWDVYYQVGIFSVCFCHPRSSPLGLIWLKCSRGRVLVTLVCWIKPRLPAGIPTSSSGWNPSSRGTHHRPSALPTHSGSPLLSTMSRDTPRWDLQPFPSQVPFPYNQVFSSQVSSDYQGIQTCKLKSLHFLKTSVLLNWFGVKG